MQETSGQPAGRAENEMWLTMIVRYVWCHRGIRLSIGTAILLLVWDAAITGSWLLSFLFCPIWFVLSILKNAIQHPAGDSLYSGLGFRSWRLGVATANDALQLKIAEANGRRWSQPARNSTLLREGFRRRSTNSYLSICRPFHVPSIALHTGNSFILIAGRRSYGTLFRRITGKSTTFIRGIGPTSSSRC